MKNYLNFLSVMFLGVCLLVGSWQLSSAMAVDKNNTSSFTHQLLTTSELANYLGISETEVNKLGPQPSGQGTTTSVIPYIKIGNATYFPIKAVDTWLSKTESVTVQ